MNIISASYSSPEGDGVIVKTADGATVSVQLPPLPDVSGGWQAVYLQWVTDGGFPSAYVPPPSTETVESFAASQGYGLFALIDLLDMERKLTAAAIPMPPKAAAVRAWVDGVRLAFLSNEPAPPAPYTYEEVQAEVLTILLSPAP